MKAAQDLWNIICRKAGVTIPLVFIQDNSLAVGCYNVDGFTIRHNSTTQNAAAVMAVAAIAERLFDAIMIHPSEDGIIVRIKEPDSRHLQINYTPKLVRNNYVNLSASGWDRTWFHWHHIPTIGSGGAAFHQSWLQNLFVKYPQLLPAGQTINRLTKSDIHHPDLPAIIYSEWEQRGKPDVVNLFEVDGTQFWWAAIHIPPPEYLNLGEKEQYIKSLGQGIHPILKVGITIRASDGKRYPITENFFLALTKIPRQNKYARQPNWRYNYTAFYLRAWLKVKEYFESKGATNLTYNILAYSNYRCIPEGDWDLRGFHVYYTSQTARAWNEEEMLQDTVEFLKWKKYGAKVIWRPNNLLRFENRLIHPIISTFLDIVKPDGIQVPPYNRPEWPLGNGIDYYAMFRTMAGKKYFNYFDHVSPQYMEWHDRMINGSTGEHEDEDDV